MQFLPYRTTPQRLDKDVKMGRELQLELLDSLKAALEHLENLRMADPKDPFISDLKRNIRDKIAQIEHGEDTSMAGD